MRIRVLKIKKCVVLFLAVCVLFQNYTVCTQAKESAIGSIEESKFIKKEEGVVTANRLNVRTNPGVNEPVKGTLFNGDKVIIYNGVRNKDGYTWVRVRRTTDGLNGWVAKKYLK